MNICYSKTISWQVFKDEIYIIDEITNTEYLLKDVAKDIWLMIGKQYSLEKVISELNKLYSISINILKIDVLELINDLFNKRLIQK